MALSHCPSSVAVKADDSSFGFQLTYGISSTSDPTTFLQTDSITVDQYTQFFNFTGNLLSNTFWWNTTAPALPDGAYLLTSSGTFFACSEGSSDRTLPKN
jgi:hypothetical protein